MGDRYEPIEINASPNLQAIIFSANDEHLVTGGEKGIEVWRVDDGKRVARVETMWPILCLAVSQDGKWIAAAMNLSNISVWNATTYEQVLEHNEGSCDRTVDFSPDSKKLVSASRDCTATIWDFQAGKLIQALKHEGILVAAKYSPQGDKIATATRDRSIRVWDSDDGTLLVDIPVPVGPRNNNGLLWFDDHLVVASDSKIKELDASTGSVVAEWEVRKANHVHDRCIALPKHGEFVAYSAADAVTFWDTLTCTELIRIQNPPDIRCIATALNNRFAIGGLDGKIVIESWDRIIVGQGIKINSAALHAWKRDHFESAEASLTMTITKSRNRDHNAFVNRAIIRTRLKKWSMALADARTAISIQPSIIGYIAKSVVHARNGKKQKAYRACDLAFLCRRPSRIVEFIGLRDTSFLLLMKAIIVFMAGEHDDAILRLDDLITTVRPNSIFYVVLAYMHLLVGASHTECGRYEDAIQSFQCARAKLRPYPRSPLLLVSMISGWKFDNLDIIIRQHLCVALYSAGHTKDAGKSLLELVDSFEREVYREKATAQWISDFTRRCLSVSEGTSNTVLSTDAAVLYPEHGLLLMEWAKATLMSCTWKCALEIASVFTVSKYAIYHAIFKRLEASDCISDAIECLLEMASELAKTTGREQTRWIIYLKDWCVRKLEEFGDDATSTQHHDKAIIQYSAALSLKPIERRTLLTKRSKALANTRLWNDALNDANEVIVLDQSSPLGYERKHVALRGAGKYSEAEIAFKTMLAKMSDSADPEIRGRARRYVKPAVIESSIRKVIQKTILGSPLVLINTHSGHLLDKVGQASSFESQPIFNELVFSMTTQIDHSRIQDEVGQYYRYATFSHKWKVDEPQYEKVTRVVVYDLEESPTHDKLRNFCKIAREAGLHWAWADTCCINKSDPSILQEALVSMFQWYQSSSLTVVLLCDVPWRRLVDSIWNTRAWTFQEYHASKVVRFYNKDWTLYRNLNIPNHKECPEIIAEMEGAVGVSARALTALRPGLEDIREKLRLASTRQSTRVEDAAYSLLGIFSLSMPIVYGEGDGALGRLLAQLLTSSGDTSILAWIGKSGGFNSCLPATIAVFNQLPTSHIPPSIPNGDMATIITGLRQTSLSRALVIKLYDCLNELPVPLFVGKRMKLPSIAFKLGPLSISQNEPERVFRAQTTALGAIEVRVEEDLTRFNSLALVHPWIDFLLDRQPVGSVIQTITKEATDDQPKIGQLAQFTGPSNASTIPKPRAGIATRFLSLRRRPATRPGETASLLPPSTLAQMDKEKQAFRTLARLRQPFGALLFTPDPGNVAAYRRVAVESLITVQVQEITPTILDKLVNSVRVLDVL